MFGWEKDQSLEIKVPNATIDLAIMGDPKKLIGGSGHMRVRRLLVGEKCVGHPDVVQKLGANHDSLNAR